MYSKLITNSYGVEHDVSGSTLFSGEEFSDDSINEHILSQIEYIRDGHPEHKIQPIIVSLTDEEFAEFVNTLCSYYNGFRRSQFFSNKISVKLVPDGIEMIRVINLNVQ